MDLFKDWLNLTLNKTLEQKPKEIQRENLNLHLLYLGKFSTQKKEILQWLLWANKDHL